MIKFQSKQKFVSTFRHLTKRIMALVYRSIFFVYLIMLAPEGDDEDDTFKLTM